VQPAGGHQRRIARRLAGIERARRYQHHRQPVSDLRRTATELAASAEIDELLSEAEELRIRFHQLPGGLTPTTPPCWQL